MITIEHLEVLFEAAETRDEDVFGRLFERYIARYEQAQERAATQQSRSRAERSISQGSSW